MVNSRLAVGPVCESTDALGTWQLPTLRRGDILAITDTGAYSASMSMRYNGRPEIARAWV